MKLEGNPTADRGEKKGRPRNRFEGNCSNCGTKGHRAEDCRGVAKINVPANAEVGLVAATVGAACGEGKEGWDSDSGTLFHTSHTQAGMTAYKKAPAGTVAEATDGTILPVDGFGTVEVDPGPAGYYDQASEDGFRRVCARTFAEPAVDL